MTDPTVGSAVALAKAIRARKISSEEAVRTTLGRLRAAHKAYHCVVAFEESAAVQAARAIDAGIARGDKLPVLAGVPVGHKDMFDRAGKTASWGARIRARKPAAASATVIERLEAAGTVQVAAMHLTEFAFGPTGHNYVLGHARNPWDPERIPGGSSSGTAIAVAAGALQAGFGSDTGGSLRVPAACCGVASIKPTYTRVSRAGCMPLAPSLDTVGALARHVEDLAAILGAIAGHDPRDPVTSHRPVPNYLRAMTQDVAGVRVGIDETLIAEASSGVQQRCAAMLAVLKGCGLKATSIRFPDWTTLDHLGQLVQFPEATAAHAQYLQQRPDDYGPQVRARLEYGYAISSVDHLTAIRARGTLLAETLAKTFAKADVALLPVSSDFAPTLAELDVAGGPAVQATMARVMKYTRPLNYLGLPTLVLASPRDGGFPCGLQLVGKPFAEGLLLAIGRAYQQAVPPEIATPLA